MASSTPPSMGTTAVVEPRETGWQAIEPTSTQAIVLKETDPVIHLAGLSFDPAVDAFDSIVSPLDTAGSTTMYLLQLYKNDGQIMDELSELYDVHALERHSPGVYIVRISDALDIDSISNHEDVRWIGPYEPFMRTTSDVLGAHLVQIVLASDIQISDTPMLSADLIRYGATTAWCSIDMCEAAYESGMDSLNLRKIASHEDVMFVQRAFSLSLHNNIAATEVGAVAVRSSSTLGLDGSGETIAVMDTGIDNDHPDLLGRVVAINTQFGLDPSPSDSNSGHGTHVVMTVLGDGTGDASTVGVAPDANLVMYALEHDPTGYFGRQGSIYDLLSDAELKTARIAVNAWGSNGNFGYYTADSRSADQYVSNNPYLLPVFSVGDNGGSGASQITAPGTAKNVLSIGSSNNGSVSSSSSDGPTLDGRIKPDLVAPGEGICSAREKKPKASLEAFVQQVLTATLVQCTWS